MKTLFYLPLLLASLLQLLLPRVIFKATYRPSSNAVRDAETDIKNLERLAAYKAKKILGMHK